MHRLSQYSINVCSREQCWTSSTQYQNLCLSGYVCLCLRGCLSLFCIWLSITYNAQSLSFIQWDSATLYHKAILHNSWSVPCVLTQKYLCQTKSVYLYCISFYFWLLRPPLALYNRTAPVRQRVFLHTEMKYAAKRFKISNLIYQSLVVISDIWEEDLTRQQKNTQSSTQIALCGGAYLGQLVT